MYGILSAYLLITTISRVSSISDLPHIIIILADDLGWNDVSFHGSNQFLTPNIDALAYSGLILKDYYTQPICTPSRAALLSGKHPIHNGMQHDVIYAPEPWGLPLTEKLMPEFLQDLGYTTRAVGKWHLGFFKADYTPSRRGFDSHYGAWLGHQDHYTHMAFEKHPGFDFHRELNVSWEAKGKYAADIFTEEAEHIIQEHDVESPLFLYLAHISPHAPLEAPQDLINQFRYIPDRKRRTFAAMVTKLDESVGRVTQALRDKNMLNNSIILFLSDNGGATNGFNGNVASNWPLRGGKDTLWEGGVRVVGAVWSPLLSGTPRVHRGLINSEDWLPTLLSAAEGLKDEDVNKFDGFSQWDALNKRGTAPYDTLLHNIDDNRTIRAIRKGPWKIVIGRTYGGQYDGHYGKLSGKVAYDPEVIRDSMVGRAIQDTSSPLPSSQIMLDLRAQATVTCTPSSDTSECKPHIAPCLFNIVEDPCEYHNLAAERPDVVNDLIELLKSYHPVPINNKPEDPRSFPSNWNNTWTTWMDFV
ncbi:arylsulfatase B-like isoform X2 [Homalodisca vitripennis]|uniref:arylsulfatase B-like isoform X2 n=1 Tax=Homalodisca vitripennis TaxID=197043 RepID=UPI001EEC6B6F|nr:arylsulfatase B-like isoform X2 [Homalodisca vitripennis]